VPVAAPPRFDFAAIPAKRPSRDQALEAELRLMVERTLTLVPPEGATDFPLVDPFAVEPVMSIDRPGETLFGRVAMLARGEGNRIRERVAL
jgi:hypothetical protein